jgi:hypothetical protein
MISEKDEAILGVALANERIASEVVARVSGAGADAADAAAKLAVIDDSEKEQKEIREYLIVATASRSAGNEIADQLELAVEILGYQAADLVANNAALNAAQAKIAALSDATKEILVVSMANRASAGNVADEIDASGVALAAVVDAII